MRRPGKTKANAGETLVEVMASVVIFLMMVGILQSAILYSRAALEKSRQMREDNEAICEIGPKRQVVLLRLIFRR